ncbi:septum site-determining protein Ssd [Nocardioides sp.]|uniref:septum site-determining protein Ssd n=1 Tax=Nocardioides sp. TaxID=35761 RepID=UPI00262CA10C|nr:septum site-determining protein Ssd [Nocardioides sp.]
MFSSRRADPTSLDQAPVALLVTADDWLRDVVVRLGAAAGVAVVAVDEIGAAYQAWAGAGVVLIGCDRAASLATLAPERRSGVWVLAPAGQADSVLRSALLLGAEQVVELPDAEPALAALLGDLGEAGGLRGLVIGVVGGSGGVGATTLACALGQVAEAPAVVVELEALGPGVDRVLGLEETSGVGWAELGSSRGRLNGRSLREALPAADGLAVLTVGREVELPAPSVVREVLAALRRGHECVVLDLPRPGTTLWDEIVPRCESVVVVADGSVTGVASAGRVVRLLPDATRACAVLRAGRSDPVLVESALGIPVVGLLPRSRRISESIDLGYGPVRSARDPLARVARATLAAVSR